MTSIKRFHLLDEDFFTQQIMDLDSLNFFVFCRKYFDNMKGVKEINLSKQEHMGVLLVMGKLQSIQGYVWKHTFVYHSNFLDGPTGCVGIIIDSDKNAGIRVLEGKGSSSKIWHIYA